MGKHAYTHPIQVNKEMNEKFGKLKQIKIKDEYIIVKCYTTQQKYKLLEAMELQDRQIIVTEAWTKTNRNSVSSDVSQPAKQYKGIIFGVPLEITDD